jgi:hypothetical protein
VFVGFSRIFLLGILIFKGLTARRLYKSFGVKGLIIPLARLTHGFVPRNSVFTAQPAGLPSNLTYIETINEISATVSPVM